MNGTSSGKLLEMLHMTDKSETTKHLEKHVEISLAKESLLKFKSVLKESVKIYEDTKLTKKVRLSASAGARALSLSLSLEDVKLSAPLFSPLPTTTGRQPRLRAQAQGDVPQGHQVLQDPRDLARDDPQVRAAGRSDHHVAARRARRRRRQGVRDVVDPGLAPDRRRRLRRRRRRQDFGGGREAETVRARLPLVRSVWLRCVCTELWEAIEADSLPEDSLATRVLLNAIEITADSVTDETAHMTTLAERRAPGCGKPF